MYGRIQQYQQDADALAQRDYAYGGLGYVTSPEALVAGEGFARATNEMAGVGQGSPPQTDTLGRAWRQIFGVCALSFGAGMVAGAIAKHYYDKVRSY